jgi:hypothetical protein
MRIHGGDVRIDDNVGGGAVLTLDFAGATNVSRLVDKRPSASLL